MDRLTQREWEAIVSALSFVLAGDLDDYWEDDAYEVLASAQRKAQQRIKDE